MEEKKLPPESGSNFSKLVQSRTDTVRIFLFTLISESETLIGKAFIIFCELFNNGRTTCPHTVIQRRCLSSAICQIIFKEKDIFSK